MQPSIYWNVYLWPLLQNMNRFKNLVFVLLGITLLATSCIRKKEIESIVRIADSQFHGVNLGDTPKQVMVAEQGNKLGDKSNGESFISYEFDLGSGEHYFVGYSFDNGKLYDIQVDFFLKDAERADELFQQFKEFYTLKYADPHVQEGYTVWTDNEKNKQVTVSLIDESTEFQNGGKLSLSIFNINY